MCRVSKTWLESPKWNEEADFAFADQVGTTTKRKRIYIHTIKKERKKKERKKERKKKRKKELTHKKERK